MTLFWIALAHGADCPAPVAVDELQARLDEAESAYADLDVDGLTAASDTFVLMLPCLAEPAPPELAARTHRTFALLRWGEGREDEARRSLAALRRIQGDAALPDTLVPPGHPLHGALAGATPGGTVPLDPPADGQLLFDGAAALARPEDEPTLAQWARQDGTIGWSVLARPGAALPDYGAVAPEPEPPPAPEPVAAAPEPAPVPLPEPAPRRSSGLSTALFATSAATAVGAGALYGGAWAANRSFFTYEPPAGTSGADAVAALESRQATAGALTAGAISLGVVALGAGVTGVVVR